MHSTEALPRRRSRLGARSLERFKAVDLHPDKVSNHDMGTVFEELIRRFNEALNENPGEHFTPRDVVRLMAGLLLSGDAGALGRTGAVRTMYDPCCGSGGMLTIAKEQIHALNPGADVHLFGQEVNPETWAIAKSDMPMISPSGRDADNIAYGSTLSADKHAARRFDYLLTNRKDPQRKGKVQLIDAAGLWTPMRKSLGDKQDGEVGKVGCEINFNRYFYIYTPPRPLAEIEADIRALEGEIMAMLPDLQAAGSMLS